MKGEMAIGRLGLWEGPHHALSSPGYIRMRSCKEKSIKALAFSRATSSKTFDGSSNVSNLCPGCTISRCVTTGGGGQCPLTDLSGK